MKDKRQPLNGQSATAFHQLLAQYGREPFGLGEGGNERPDPAFVHQLSNVMTATLGIGIDAPLLEDMLNSRIAVSREVAAVIARFLPGLQGDDGQTEQRLREFIDAAG